MTQQSRLFTELVHANRSLFVDRSLAAHFSIDDPLINELSDRSIEAGEAGLKFALQVARGAVLGQPALALVQRII